MQGCLLALFAGTFGWCWLPADSAASPAWSLYFYDDPQCSSLASRVSPNPMTQINPDTGALDDSYYAVQNQAKITSLWGACDEWGEPEVQGGTSDSSYNLLYWQPSKRGTCQKYVVKARMGANPYPTFSTFYTKLESPGLHCQPRKDLSYQFQLEVFKGPDCSGGLMPEEELQPAVVRGNSVRRRPITQYWTWDMHSKTGQGTSKQVELFCPSPVGNVRPQLQWDHQVAWDWTKPQDCQPLTGHPDMSVRLTTDLWSCPCTLTGRVAVLCKPITTTVATTTTTTTTTGAVWSVHFYNDHSCRNFSTAADMDPNPYLGSGTGCLPITSHSLQYYVKQSGCAINGSGAPTFESYADPACTKLLESIHVPAQGTCTEFHGSIVAWCHTQSVTLASAQILTLAPTSTAAPATSSSGSSIAATTTTTTVTTTTAAATSSTSGNGTTNLQSNGTTTAAAATTTTTTTTSTATGKLSNTSTTTTTAAPSNITSCIHAANDQPFKVKNAWGLFPVLVDPKTGQIMKGQFPCTMTNATCPRKYHWDADIEHLNVEPSVALIELQQDLANSFGVPTSCVHGDTGSVANASSRRLSSWKHFQGTLGVLASFTDEDLRNALQDTGFHDLVCAGLDQIITACKIEDVRVSDGNIHFLIREELTTTTEMPWGIPWWAWFLICCFSALLCGICCFLPAVPLLAGGGKGKSKSSKSSYDGYEAVGVDDAVTA